MKFTIERYNDLYKWVRDTSYVWSIEPEGDNTPTGFHHFLLKIGEHYASFRFDPVFKILYIKLYGRKDQVVLN